MTEREAQRQLSTPAPPVPNIMGRDRMRIIERRWVMPKSPYDKPFEVITTDPWEIF